MSQTLQKKIEKGLKIFVQLETYIYVLLYVNVGARWQSPGKVIRGGQALILNKGWWLTLSDWHCDQLSSPAKKYNWRRWLLWTEHKVQVETNKGNRDLESGNH